MSAARHSGADPRTALMLRLLSTSAVWRNRTQCILKLVFGFGLCARVDATPSLIRCREELAIRHGHRLPRLPTLANCRCTLCQLGINAIFADTNINESNCFDDAIVSGLTRFMAIDKETAWNLRRLIPMFSFPSILILLHNFRWLVSRTRREICHLDAILAASSAAVADFPVTKAIIRPPTE